MIASENVYGGSFDQYFGDLIFSTTLNYIFCITSFKKHPLQRFPNCRIPHWEHLLAFWNTGRVRPLIVSLIISRHGVVGNSSSSSVLQPGCNPFLTHQQRPCNVTDCARVCERATCVILRLHYDCALTFVSQSREKASLVASRRQKLEMLFICIRLCFIAVRVLRCYCSPRISVIPIFYVEIFYLFQNAILLLPPLILSSALSPSPLANLPPPISFLQKILFSPTNLYKRVLVHCCIISLGLQKLYH